MLGKVAKPRASYQSELNLEYRKRFGAQADLVVRERSLPLIPMDAVFFLSIVLATPILKRYPEPVTAFGGFIVVLVALRFYLAIYWKKIHARSSRFWSLLSTGGSHLSALGWGAFTCATVASFELGWTSFFVLILSVGICASIVPAQSPKLPLLRWNLILMLVPSIVANIVFVGGLRGFAIAGFYVGFFILLMIQARVQNDEYWRGVQDNARLQAIIDALPGTLSWISSDLTYLGANQNLAEIWNTSPDSISGKPVGLDQARSEFREFMKALFSSPLDRISSEMRCRTPTGEKFFYLVAQKYKQGTESVVLGLDITDYKSSIQELELRRNQGIYSAKLASLGEIVASLSDEIGMPLNAIEATLSTLTGATDDKTRSAIDRAGRMTSRVIQLTTVLSRFLANDKFEAYSLVNVRELIQDTLLLCTERYAMAEVSLEVGDFDSDLKLECQPTQILVVLLNLLLNSFDAVRKSKDRWVRIGVQRTPIGIDISVTDSGGGIPEDVRRRIFEPLYTSKEGGGGTGVGLSTARMIIEKHAGRLWIDSECSNTRFVISLPQIENLPIPPKPPVRTTAAL